MAQLLAASFWKTAAPLLMNWNPDQKLCGTKRFQVKIGWTLFYLLIYCKLLYEVHICKYCELTTIFHCVAMKWSASPCSHSFVNIWWGWILSWALVHCKTWESIKFQLLWGFHTRGSHSTLHKSSTQRADGGAAHSLLAQSRFPAATQ